MKGRIVNITRRKKIIFVVGFLLGVAVTIAATVLAGRSRGEVHTNGVIESEILGKELRFSVYLPPDYHKNKELAYPVLFLLHGFRDDHTTWVKAGDVRHIADETILSGRSKPMIIVIPEAPGAAYLLGAGTEKSYERYFFDELLPYLEKNYRLAQGRDFRGIGGVSMGGHAAIVYACTYPESFATCCPLGASFSLVPAGEEPQNFPQISPELSFGSLLAEETHFVRLHIDCGRGDSLLAVNEKLHERLEEIEYPHEFQTRNGGHEWGCWQATLPVVMEFFCEGIP